MQLNFFEKFLNKLEMKIFHVGIYYVFEFDLNVALERIKLAEQPKIEVEIIQATLKDVEELANLGEIKASIVRTYLSRGDYCFYARSKGGIVGYAWYSPNKADFHGDFNVPENMVYAHSAYTVPEYRRLGVSIAIVLYAFSYLIKEGYRSEYYWVSIDNFPNLKRNEVLGTNKLGVLIFTKFLWRGSFRVISEIPENAVKIKKYFNIV